MWVNLCQPPKQAVFFFLQLCSKIAWSEFKRGLICPRNLPVRLCCWPHMKEMMSSHRTGGLLIQHCTVCRSNTHTHMHAEEQSSPCAVPASHQMAHLLRPSTQQDGGLLVPTDHQPSSRHASWQAGDVTALLVADQMLLAAHPCCSAAKCSPTTTTKKSLLSLYWIRRQTYTCNHIQKCLWRTSSSNTDNITARANVSLAEASSLSQCEDCAGITEEVN